jgi:hypothetical protein
VKGQRERVNLLNGAHLSGYAFDTLHSAEYELTVQKTAAFYNRLLEEVDIPFVP